MFAYRMFDVSEHLSFQKKHVCLLAVDYGLMSFVWGTASAEASPHLTLGRFPTTSRRPPEYPAGHSECSPLLVRPNGMSLVVYLKVKQHDAYSGEQGAKTKSLSVKLPLKLARRGADKGGGQSKTSLTRDED